MRLHIIIINPLYKLLGYDVDTHLLPTLNITKNTLLSTTLSSAKTLCWKIQ